MPPPREAVGVGGGLRRIGLLVSAARSRPGGVRAVWGPSMGQRVAWVVSFYLQRCISLTICMIHRFRVRVNPTRQRWNKNLQSWAKLIRNWYKNGMN